MLKEFREFAIKGSVVDLAVGIMLGAAFNSVVNSIVRDIITPPIGFLLGRVDFSNLYILLREGRVPEPYASLAEAQSAGAVTINIGVFLNSIISFIIITFVLFLIIRVINRLRREAETLEGRVVSIPAAPSPQSPPATRECPYCLSTIPAKATRCAHCTSEVPPI